MSRSDWLNLAIFVVAVVYSLWNRRSSEAPAEPPDEPDPPPVPTTREDASASREARARAAELASEVATLSERLETLRGPVAVLRRVLAAQVAAPLQAVQASLERGEAALTRGDDPRADLALLGQRLYAIGIVAEARADTAGAALLGDADAVADALLRPLRQHARTLGHAAFDERVVCMPTSPGFESVILGLFEAHPVVFTPPDFGENLHRWAAIPHEIAHVVWHRWPGFAAEATTAFGLERRPWLPRRDASGVYRSRIEDALAAWLEELHADLFAVVLLGPAAARGLAACFATPGKPALAVTAHTLDDLTYAPHPPATLRVRWTAHALHRQGFAGEAQAILRSWTRQHGDQTTLTVPLTGGLVAEVALEPFFEAGCALVDAYLDRAWSSLGGTTLGGVPGLELGPGRQAQVTALAQSLMMGTAQARDAALLLAAAIEARERAPQASAAITRALQRSIQGLEAGERRAEDPRFAPQASAPTGGPVEAEELAAALALGDVLTQRRGAALSYKSR